MNTTKKISIKNHQSDIKIGIICAGDEELAPFLPLIDNCTITEKARLKFYTGEIHGIKVTALFSGVCKVNAAIASQILIDFFKPDIIINSGTAGGIAPNLKILDTVISTEACYHDVAQDILTEFHPWLESIFFKADSRLIETSKIAVKKMKAEETVFWGRMVTGESFINDEERKKINNRLSPLTTDMETASIAHVCYANDIPFLSIRCITDNAEHDGIGNFEKNCAKASAIAKDITIALLKELRL